MKRRATIQGKPTIFFEAQASKKKGRLAEKFVAVLEGAVLGSELLTFTPLKLPNCVNDPTELDVVFAESIDPRRVFEFVQVRDRGRTQHRQWIEEALGQRAALGTDRGILVSTSGFSKPACKLAEKKGLPLRSFLPETEANIQDWYGADVIRQSCRTVELLGGNLISLHDGQRRYRNFDDARMNEPNVLLPMNDGKRYRGVTPGWLFHALYKRSQDQPSTGSVEGDLGEFHLSLEMGEQSPFFINVALEDEVGREQVVAITGHGVLRNTSIDAPIAHRWKYVDAIGGVNLAQMITAEMEIQGSKWFACVYRLHIPGAEHAFVGGAFFPDAPPDD